MTKRSWQLNAILAAFAFLVLAPTIALSAYIAWRSAQQAQKAAQAQIIEQNHVYLRALDLLSQNIIRTLDTIDLMTEDVESYAKLERRMRILAPQLGSAFAVRDGAGQQLINTIAPEGAALPVTRAKAILDGDALIRETGKPVHIAGYKGTFSDQYFVAISAPLRVEGRSDLFMTIAIAARDLRDRILGQAPPGWTLSIVDQNGMAIARSADHDRLVGRMATPDMLSAISKADQGTLRTRTLAGDFVFASFAKSKLSGWTVVASAPVATIEKPSREFARGLFLMILSGVVVSLLAGFEYWRRMTRAIMRLRGGAANLAAENNVSTSPTGVVELDNVQRAMADAAHTLRERTEHQRALLREMNHRVKNKLAIARAMMIGTLDAHAVPQGVRDMADSRLLALSAAHEVSTANEWRRVRLDALVKAIAEKMEASIAEAGPEVKLADRAVVPLGQALHEAFVTLGDRTSVTWSLDAAALHIQLKGAGAKRGDQSDRDFAHRIVHATIVRQLDGAIQASAEAMTWILPLKSRLGEVVHVSDRA